MFYLDRLALYSFGMSSAVGNSSKAPDYGVAFMDECVIAKGRKIYSPGATTCHILCGHDPKTGYSFKAHLAGGVQLKSLGLIFDRLKSLGSNPDDLIKLRLMGGDKNSSVTAERGAKVVEVLKRLGIFERCDLTYYQAGKIFGTELSTDGQLTFFKKPWKKIQQQQGEKRLAFEKECAKLAEGTTVPVLVVMAEKIFIGTPIHITVLD